MASRCARRFALTLSLAATLAAGVVASSHVDAKTFFYAHGVLAEGEPTGFAAEGEPTDFAAEPAPGRETARHEVGFDDSLAVGGRIGVWFGREPWFGLALDGLVQGGRWHVASNITLAYVVYEFELAN